MPAVVAPALAVSVCCLVSFYYNDLYELRALRDIRGMAPRVLQSLAITVLLVGSAYAVLPGVELSAPLLVSLFLLVVGLVMPLRAVSYGLIAQQRGAAARAHPGHGPAGAEDRRGDPGRRPCPTRWWGWWTTPAWSRRTPPPWVSPALVRPFTEVESADQASCARTAWWSRSASGAAACPCGACSLRARAACAWRTGSSSTSGSPASWPSRALSPSFLIFHQRPAEVARPARACAAA